MKIILKLLILSIVNFSFAVEKHTEHTHKLSKEKNN
ncbi:MAG: hypothetical protein ACJAS9_000210 [Polaribacter sp.]|jgi:hypothetical protein